MKYNAEFLKQIKMESYVNPKVECRHSEGKGKGLFAIEKISKDEIVSISGGVIIESKDWAKFRETNGDYAYFIDEKFLIAPLNPEDPSDDWRMNHCCEANCGLNGQIIFVAMRDIEVGEELFFDYAMTETDPDYSLDLHCDKSTCRKHVTGNDWKNPEIQKKYSGYFSLYIEKKISR
jgi:hypothetical protein